MTQASETPTVPLAGGVAMPLVGFGTWDLRGEQGYEAVRYALEVGYRHLDTATMYANETQVGRALRDSGLAREDVFVTTKLMPDRGRPRDTLTASLRALGVDQVDLWLVHYPPHRAAGVAVWRDVLAARDAGQARSVGVSNYGVQDLDELMDATGQAPAANQIRWSPALYDPWLVAEHERRGVVVEGYSPLKATDLGDPVLADIAAAHGVTPAQVVLRWHVQRGIPVIPKSGRRERIVENLDLFRFALSDEELARVDGLSRRARR